MKGCRYLSRLKKNSQNLKGNSSEAIHHPVQNHPPQKRKKQKMQGFCEPGRLQFFPLESTTKK